MVGSTCAPGFAESLQMQRRFTLNFDDAETDLDEDTARELFESLATPVLRDAEARLRKVMEG